MSLKNKRKIWPNEKEFLGLTPKSSKRQCIDNHHNHHSSARRETRDNFPDSNDFFKKNTNIKKIQNPVSKKSIFQSSFTDYPDGDDNDDNVRGIGESKYDETYIESDEDDNDYDRNMRNDDEQNDMNDDVEIKNCLDKLPEDHSQLSQWSDLAQETIDKAYLLGDKCGISTKLSTPVKYYREPDDALDHIDSGKKKRKFVTGGLAERLKLLLDRKKRDKLFSNHKYKTSKDLDDSYSGDLEQRFQVQLTGPGLKQNHLVVFDCSLTGVPPSVVGNDGAVVNYKVMLSKEVVLKENLFESCLLNIYPPWFILALNPNNNVIFCSDGSRAKEERD